MSQAMQELMLGGQVQQKEFATLINALEMPHDATPLLLVEMQPRRVVKQEHRQELLLLREFKAEGSITAYTSGRIFHIHGELRWERQETHIRVVYTGERAYAPTLNDSEEEGLDAYNTVTRNYLLFGKRLDEGQRKRIGPEARSGDFAEVRIPRLLRYPQLPALEDAQHIQLAVCEYVDPLTGANVVYRFKQLVPFRNSQ